MARTFNLRKFVLKTLMGMKDNYSEFQVREYALNWYEKKYPHGRGHGRNRELVYTV